MVQILSNGGQRSELQILLLLTGERQR